MDVELARKRNTTTTTMTTRSMNGTFHNNHDYEDEELGSGPGVEDDFNHASTRSGDSSYQLLGRGSGGSGSINRGRSLRRLAICTLLLAFVFGVAILIMGTFVMETDYASSSSSSSRSYQYTWSSSSSGFWRGRGKKRPLVIGHRGSCGMMPEHTLEGYNLAIKQGADCIECDVILTKDGIPICRHDLTLEQTTDVASRPQFAKRKTRRQVEGEEVEGYFAVDFTLAEIKELRALQRLDFRDPNYNGLFEVATLQEQIDLVKRNFDVSRNQTKSIKWHLKLLNSFLGFPDIPHETNTCLYPEMKSTTWHNSLHMWNGKRSEDIILEVLEKNGFKSKEDNIYLQSFETLDLQYVHKKSDMKLIQLLGAPDEIQWDTKRPYADMMTQNGMEDIAAYAFAASPSKNDILPKNTSTGYIDEPTVAQGKSFVDMIHKTGLEVHPYVLRDENRYLAWNYGQDAYNEYTMFIRDIQVDGFFTDFPKTATNYIRLFELENTF